MDFKAFSDENFEVVNWINECFRNERSTITNRESHASNLVYKLQLFVQEINCSLEETAQQVLHNLSKTTREVETLQEEAAFMKNEILRIKDDLKRTQQFSNDALESLVNTEKVKNRMQDSCKALREADNWSTLSCDVELIFESGDVQQISSKLIEMQNSLDLLIDVPDYHERVTRLNDLKERFEALVNEPMKHCFSNLVVESANTFVTTFKKLRRMQSLIQLYTETLRSHLLNEWQKIMLLDSEEVVEELNSFYDTILSTWHSHSTFSLNVMFGGNYNFVFNTLTNVLIAVFQSTEDSISKCIHKELEARKRSGNLKNCLDFLVEVKQVTDRLTKSLEANITSESKEFLCKPQLEIMMISMYAAYRNALLEYPQLEEAILSQEYSKIVDIELGESVSKVFSVARESEKRCYLLTHSTAIPNLLKALQSYFESYLDHIKRCLVDIEKQCFSDYDFTSLPNWSLFQKALFYLQAVGDFTLQLTLFEEQLKNTCEELTSKMNPEMTIFQRFHDLLLNGSTRDSLNELFLQIRRADGNSTFILYSSYSQCKQLCCEATEVVLKVAINYVKIHLNVIKFTECEVDEDTPSFTYSPQEYITQIGQYLLTIPQHIEPFTLQENSAFKLALSHTVENNDSSMVENVTEFLLKAIIQRVIDLYISAIRIQHLSNVHHKHQLVTDIDYICEVFDDLGFGPDSELHNIVEKLKS